MDGYYLMALVGYVIGVCSYPGFKTAYKEWKIFQEEVKEMENNNEHI